MKYKIEKDSMGEIQVPADAFYAAQTQRAVENFPISGLTMPRPFISALGKIKQCCATVNLSLGLIDKARADAIIVVAKSIANGDYDAQFPIDVFQTGSGTSSNMNANEVIAHLASQKAKCEVNPNDHVNMSQSSNDVIPTAIHVSAACEITNNLKPALENLAHIIGSRIDELNEAVKTGRTHLMDAMPVTFGQELSGWKQQIDNGIARLESSLPRLLELAQGGTAVGTGVNCDPKFADKFCKSLSDLTNIPFISKPNKFEALSAQDAAVEMSGQLRTISVSLMKISNDLRWMNSGPLSGISDIQLPALQPGSSIMPGKVNPVIPEAVAMACAQVIGNDTTVTVAGQSGNFQLNVMLPVIAYNLLQSIHLLANSARVLGEKTIQQFTINREMIDSALNRNPILVTALNRLIGYEKGAMIAKKAYAQGRDIFDVALEESGLPEEELRKLLDPKELTRS